MVFRFVIIALGLFTLSITLLVVTKEPTHDLMWQDQFLRMPQFEELEENNISLLDLRNFGYEIGGQQKPAWRTEELDLDDLSEVWFFTEPFARWDAIGHTFISFVFEGETNKTVSVSVEARLEKSERYSGVKGVFNEFELIYVWSTEKDILTRIAVGLENDLYAYRLDATDEQIDKILRHFILRSKELVSTPRFYNTLTSNCTNELAKSVNDAYPGALPWRPYFFLTAEAAEYLHRNNWIYPSDQPFEELKVQSEIGQLVRNLNSLPESEFSEAWRQQLLDILAPLD